MDRGAREDEWTEYADHLEYRLALARAHTAIVALRLALAQRRIEALSYELKYRPDQPRVPAGYREGGQWTIDGSGTPSAHPRRRSPAGSDDPQAPPRSPPEPDLGAIFGIGTADAAERASPKPGYKVSLPVTRCWAATRSCVTLANRMRFSSDGFSSKEFLPQAHSLPFKQQRKLSMRPCPAMQQSSSSSKVES